MHRKTIIIMALLMLAGVCKADFWSTVSQDVAMTDDVSLGLVSEVRSHEDISDVFIQYAGVKRKVNDKWSLGGWYKYVIKEGNNESHRALADATLREGILSNRFRFEYNVTDASLVYRNKVTASVPVFGDIVCPFVSDEYFVNVDPSYGYRENRAWLGAKVKVRGATLGLSYLWRDMRKNNIEAVCLSASFKF